MLGIVIETVIGNENEVESSNSQRALYRFIWIKAKKGKAAGGATEELIECANGSVAEFLASKFCEPFAVVANANEISHWGEH